MWKSHLRTIPKKQKRKLPVILRIKAGWIPIDATMHESDYLDSGHIRLGELKTRSTVINFREQITLVPYPADLQHSLISKIPREPDNYCTFSCTSMHFCLFLL